MKALFDFARGLVFSILFVIGFWVVTWSFLTGQFPGWFEVVYFYYAVYWILIDAVIRCVILSVRSVVNLFRVPSRMRAVATGEEKFLVFLQNTRPLFFFLGVLLIIGSLYFENTIVALFGGALMFFPNGAYYVVEKILMHRTSAALVTEQRKSAGYVSKLLALYSLGLVVVHAVSGVENLEVWVLVYAAIVVWNVLETGFYRVITFDPKAEPPPPQKGRPMPPIPEFGPHR